MIQINQFLNAFVEALKYLADNYTNQLELILVCVIVIYLLHLLFHIRK